MSDFFLAAPPCAKLKYIYEYQIMGPLSSGKERVYKLKLHNKEVSRSNRLEGHGGRSKNFNYMIVSCRLPSLCLIRLKSKGFPRLFIEHEDN